jgi:purine-nucleoside phosphorylase
VSLRALDEAASFVAGRSAHRPRVGLVLGSGLGAFADTLEEATAIPYADIPRFPTSTAVGHKGELVLGRAAGVPVAVMAGRVHFYEGYTMAQVVFPVRVLGRLGVRTLILTNAAGGMGDGYRPGDLMVITDHLNLLGTNPLIGPNEPCLGERFFDMTEAYDPGLAEAAERACREVGLRVHRGVYAGLTGPSYETPAEIRMLKALGADAVGMSTVPEVIAARHMGLRVAGVSCITNVAAGLGHAKLDHREVLEVGERTRASLIEVLRRLVRDAAAAPDA